MYVTDLVTMVDCFRKEVTELESSLKHMRDSYPDGWERGIEKDERYPVKVLYTTLQEKRKELNVLLAKQVDFREPFKRKAARGKDTEEVKIDTLLDNPFNEID